ncbi:VOC family protein [Paenibacillus nasutitermitis]|uniref:VOC family protein n=1 Tax=Paenibacillus nasutitermitis TaxID=1652958 RepID=A0A916ZG87_9BACL|nr:VOC family protein [Paenibacillus nasutitermitis]GGD96318.1 VOC family protein [Paenibacillus nasutitermitis]
MKAQLTPYLLSEDARTQAETYKQALGGEIHSVMTHGQIPGTPEAIKDKVMHMVMTVAGENTLFLSDAFEQAGGRRNSIALTLAFESETEARQIFANLVEIGEVKYPFDPQPWGGYYGEVADKFGITWQIVKQ